MPELPEVRCIAEMLNQKIKDIKILKVIFFECSKVINDGHLYSSDFSIQNDEDEYYVNINQVCKAVTYYGKKICFLFDTFAIISALAMEGRWSFIDRGNTSIKICCENEVNLYFNDIECQGNFSIVNYESQSYCHIFKDVGYDYDDERLTLDVFKSMIIQKKLQKKYLYDFLLDQKYFSGIGNYLRSEIIYESKLKYDIQLGELSENDISKLYYAIKTILDESYKCGGLTLSSYYKPDGSIGTYQPKIYMKKYTPCGAKVNVTLVTGKRKIYHI